MRYSRLVPAPHDHINLTPSEFDNARAWAARQTPTSRFQPFETTTRDGTPMLVTYDRARRSYSIDLCRADTP